MFDAQKLIEEIRAVDPSLVRARISSVDIKKSTRSVRFTVICDQAVSETHKEKVLSIINESVPDSFHGVSVEIKKIVTDKELIEDFIHRFIVERYRSISHAVFREDITAETSGEVSRYVIRATESTAQYFERNRVLSEINEELCLNFCGLFSGEIVPKQATDNAKEILSSYVETACNIEEITYRTLKVNGVVEIDDATKKDVAVYIADAVQPVDEITLAGKITSIRQKETKTGKPFYIIDFSDTTAGTGGTYFPTKRVLEKVAELKEGDGIIVTGSMEIYNDSLSFRIRKLNRCTFPEDFVPEEKEGKKAEAFYTRIFPEPVEEIKQADMFDDGNDVPACLMGRTFVVFDLETTGKNVLVDTITEVGAVKIVDGKITEKFGTLVNPEQPISQFITDLTGIDDAMVKDAPKYSEIVADFYKFTDGATLVAHNADFDCKFVRHLGKKEGYYYNHDSIDTVQFARDVLPTLSNHKLNTVADHFGFEFRHHRAWADALVTAQIFLELVKIKKSVPKR